VFVEPAKEVFRIFGRYKHKTSLLDQIAKEMAAPS